MSVNNSFITKKFRKQMREAEKQLAHYTRVEKITACKNLYKMYKNDYRGNVYLELLKNYIGYDETIKFVKMVEKGGKE